MAGPISGASLNPVRSLGPALVSGDLAAIWVYLVGPMHGAIAVAVVYRYLRGGDWPATEDGVARRAVAAASSVRDVP